MDPVLSVQGVTVRFGDHLALNQADLSLAANETLAVLGPSGSGKSTLLRAIAGLEPLAAGRIESLGVDLAPFPTHRRELGLMFQDATLFPHRDVLGNVMFGLIMKGEKRENSIRRAQAALELVGMEKFADRSVSDLSGGEAQRVALARALAPEPKLLMLDEPFGALDRPRREELNEELRSLCQRLPTAVLLVTHDHTEAFALGDRVMVLREGKVEQTATPTDLWRNPASPFVAEFLGWNVTHDAQGRVTAIRPDSITLTCELATDQERATVVARTFRKNHWRIRVETVSQQILEVEIANSNSERTLGVDGEGLAIGQSVGVAIDPGATISFPELPSSHNSNKH